MNRKIGAWPTGIILREWQREASLSYTAANKRHFLLVAVPGAGKTTATGAIAHNLFESGEIARIVVVSPTDNIRSQWVTGLHGIGIELNDAPDALTFGDAKGFHGVSLTYQQVRSNPDRYRAYCAHQSTLVVFDEIHHAGENKDWGDRLVEAFNLPSVRTLALSGTPFRSDNNPIAFVDYIDGKCVPDFSYGNERALKDGVVRCVNFMLMDGKARWVDAFGERECRFDERVDRRTRSRIKLAALEADLPESFVQKMLETGHRALQVECREKGHYNAGGLVIAKDIVHAGRVARQMKSLLGVEPTVVHSDDSDSRDKIRRFREGSDPWIVAVKMVSEGVDIPRLRVLVYLTQTKADLSIRQAIGRVVRMVPDVKSQIAHVLFPAWDEFRAVATEYSEDQKHVLLDDLREMEEEDEALSDSSVNGDGQCEMDYFQPTGSEALGYSHIFDGEEFAESDIRIAQEICSRRGINLDPIQVAMIGRDFVRNGATGAAVAAQITEPTKKRAPMAVRVKELRRMIQAHARKIAYHADEEFAVVQAELNARVGCFKRSACDVDDLERMLKEAQEWLREVKSPIPS